MRPVNLLPPSRRIQEGGSRPGIAYVALGVLGALLAGVVLYVVTANGVSAKQDELARVSGETEAAQRRAAALGSFSDFASIKRQREASITQLAQARLDWERLVHELSRVIPDDVYVKTLDASAGVATATAQAQGSTPGGPSLTLVGCAPSNPDIATFMVRLRKLHRAKDVSLATSNRSTGDGDCGDGYGFNVKVDFAPAPAASQSERVPAHLGGGA